MTAVIRCCVFNLPCASACHACAFRLQRYTAYWW